MTTAIYAEPSVEMLGVTPDARLNFEAHIDAQFAVNTNLYNLRLPESNLDYPHG